jgi:hypothetical protein
MHPFAQRGFGCAAPRRVFARYLIRYPDGAAERKRTTQAIQPVAKAVCFQDDEGFWLNHGVFDEPPGWARTDRYTLIEAERIG